MNGVTTVLLSPMQSQWNWNVCEDADCLRLDGKTLCTFTCDSFYREDRYNMTLSINNSNIIVNYTIHEGENPSLLETKWKQAPQHLTWQIGVWSRRRRDEVFERVKTRRISSKSDWWIAKCELNVWSIISTKWGSNTLCLNIKESPRLKYKVEAKTWVCEGLSSFLVAPLV